MSRILRFVVSVVLLVSFGHAGAETVASLPAPTGYVSDFAGVLQPSTKQQLEALCTQVDQKAKAQIAVVTINKIDSDQSIEEFSTALEDKWKVGKKGTDRGVLMLFVMNPRGGRIEVGYGLEGILNDAKVGDIGRTMSPAARAGDYNTAIPIGVNAVAQVIADDAGVTLTQTAHRYHEEPVQTQVHLSFWQVLIGGAVVVIVLIVLVSTGNAGWIFFILMNMLGGGGGGGGRGRGDGDGGGGFGGFGGGSSGGGGASGDW